MNRIELLQVYDGITQSYTYSATTVPTGTQWVEYSTYQAYVDWMSMAEMSITFYDTYQNNYFKTIKIL